jgi:HlyD family secretion protein
MNGFFSSYTNPGRLLRWGALLVLLGALIVAAGCTGRAPTGGAAPTETPRPVRASGNVVADGVVVPVLEASLSMPVGGIVQELLVSEGDQVTADQPLLRLQQGRLEAAVAQAEAGVARAQAQLDELKAGPRPEELLSAQAAVDAAAGQVERTKAGAKAEDIAAAQAAVDVARANLQQVREGATQQQVIAATADLANAQAAVRLAQAAYDRVAGEADIGRRPESLGLEQATNNFNAAKARLDDLKRGARAGDLAAAQARIRQAEAQLASLSAPARAADLATAQAELRRAQAQLDLLQAGARPETVSAAEANLASAQAALKEARAALSETELKAPFAGTVAEIAPVAGEQVVPGAVVVRLADLSAWQIETDDLTELDVVKVKAGAPASLTFDALPGVQLAGKVIKIKPIGTEKQGDMTYTVVIRPDKHEDRLHWNMTATATIE